MTGIIIRSLLCGIISGVLTHVVICICRAVEAKKREKE